MLHTSYFKRPSLQHLKDWLAVRKIAGGTVTVAYQAPYTAAPTIFQQYTSPRSLVIATVLAGAASDVLAIITHDFQLSAAEITLNYPVVVLTPLDGNAITSPWFEVSQNPNYTVLGKGSTAVGALTKVSILRPASQIR
jgi:hypothetical protein